MEDSIKMHTNLQSYETNFEWTIEDWKLSTRMTKLDSPNVNLEKINKTCYLSVDATNNILTVLMEQCAELRKSVVTLHIQADNGPKAPLEYNDVTRVKQLMIRCSFKMHKIIQKVIFYCHIKYVIENSLIEKISETPNNYLDTFYKPNLKNYQEMYEKQELCDVAFLIGTDYFKAHSVVLAAASPYFLSIFKNTNQHGERFINLTEDSDITAVNFSAFLSYIYGIKSFSEIESLAFNLTILACKFACKELQQCCEAYLLGNTLTVNNIIDSLIFAFSYQSDILKRKTLKFAKMHLIDIKKSKDFKKLCDYPDLILRLL